LINVTPDHVLVNFNCLLNLHTNKRASVSQSVSIYFEQAFTTDHARDLCLDSRSQ